MSVDTEFDHDQKASQQDAAHTMPTPPAPGPAQPPGPERSQPADDKFMRLTKKALLSTEKVIESSYKKTRQAIQNSDSRASVRFFDGFLKWLRDLYPPESFAAISPWLVTTGHVSVIASTLLALFIFTLAAMKLGSGLLLIEGVGLAALLIVLQYSAAKFLEAGESLIRSAPSRLTWPALPDCLGLLMEWLGLAAFLVVLVMARRVGQWSLVLVGMGAWTLCSAMAYFCFYPTTLNISFSEDVKPAEEAVGILALLAKVTVRATRAVFGMGSLFGAVGMALAALGLIVASSESLGAGLFLPGRASLYMVILCAAFPLAAYALFVFCQLIIDLIKAVLILPRKMDDITRK